MTVYVNGEPHEIAEGATLAQLLAAVSAPAQGIAVELNRTIVRRRDHATQALSAEDRVEIVGLVGGG